MFECCYIAGRCDHPECGAYPLPDEQDPGWAVADQCAGEGHPYYSDDGPTEDARGRCYCGHKFYPRGGPLAPEVSA